jgi:hypothetical protein
MILPREVKIEPIFIDGVLRSYFVRYLERSKYTRHLAAQFDSNFGLDYVKNWVNNNDKLKLIE